MKASTCYLCDWLPADYGAVGQYALRECRRLAAGGARVTLGGLSSTPSSVEEQELGSGLLRVVRVHATPYDRADFRARALWTLHTNFRLLGHLWHALASADEIVFTGAPPFLLHFVVPLNGLLRKRLTYRITDFHPECLIAELGRAPLWLRLFHRFTLALRQEVDRFEVLGEDQRSRLLEQGIPAERIALRPDTSPVEISPATRPLPIPASLEDRIVLLYSGNFGVAHDDATFVEGLRLHHCEGTGRIGFWLNATGAKADRVEGRLADLGLPFHRSRPLPLSELARLLVTPAAHLITLRDEFVGYVLPSKVYGCVDSGKPVLFVGSERSDVHRICRERLPAGCYWRIEVGNAAGVAHALEEIADRAEAECGVDALAAPVPLH